MSTSSNENNINVGVDTGKSQLDIYFVQLHVLLEEALKLKRIGYLHAEGYTAGEMKHGPIALADTELFIITLMT
ncbi:SIS domain-containing protein [endosymbiont of Lamellibrachia barhami]|uniref:SIS domain-containing protein n=1 Tax=endosymbiont of Lamellibrachia barhami TaxID=205975 RepID=UPI0015A786F3|nr:SIS domain-containing protein [endosymbiont of Lamellibrachia barhami]